MNALTFGMKQSCQVISVTQDHRLNFTLGTVAFTTGSLLTGFVSEATGIIKNVVVSSGAWTSSNAAGYLILSNVSGTFGTEIIYDEGTLSPGSATASGPATPLTNSVGTPTYTTTSTAYACRFFTTGQNGGSLPSYDSGKFISSQPAVFLPADAVILEGDQVSSTETGYNNTYDVTQVTTLYNFFENTIDHIEATLKAVSKRG